MPGTQDRVVSRRGRGRVATGDTRIVTFFFFQAEDGIRDWSVTGVQMCALPISTILTGFTLPESNVHSPNEKMLVEYFDSGVAAARELYTGFAALPTDESG